MLRIFKPKNPFTPFRFIFGLYNYFFTIYGKPLIFLLFFSILFYSIAPYSTYFHIIVSFLGVIFFISFISMYLLPYNIWVERKLPSRVQAGKEFITRISVKNNSFLPVYAISAEQIWKPPHFDQTSTSNLLLNIKRREIGEVSFKCRINQRGAFEVPASIVFSSFPFFLMRKGKYLRDKEIVLAYPKYTPLDGFELPVHRKYQPGGISLASSIGDSTEYMNNRDYNPGDPMKKLDWKAYARLQKLVIKEYQEEYFVRIALVLDTYIPKRVKKKQIDDFENSVSLVAAIADYLSRKEYLIDIFVMGSEIYKLASGRNIAFLQNILDLLACVDFESTEYIQNLYDELTPKLKQISSIILVLQDFDENRKKLIDLLRSLGVSLKIIIVKDKTTIPFSFKETDNLTVRFISSKRFEEGLSNL
ncbi:DUF58 domain-containing protein [Candidatus Dependentiae bacterium]|nr:DUF58 domain-containing protein [Candidatus Dependentiae bacterium]